jgi:hypothetical protein
LNDGERNHTQGRSHYGKVAPDRSEDSDGVVLVYSEDDRGKRRLVEAVVEILAGSAEICDKKDSRDCNTLHPRADLAPEGGDRDQTRRAEQQQQHDRHGLQIEAHAHPERASEVPWAIGKERRFSVMQELCRAEREEAERAKRERSPAGSHKLDRHHFLVRSMVPGRCLKTKPPRRDAE